MILWTSILYNGKVTEAEFEDPKLDCDLFQLRISETISWCKPRVDIARPAECLRSKELQAPDWSAENGPSDIPECFANPYPIEHRSELLRQNSMPLIHSEDHRGRLMVFDYEWCLYEGAVSVESSGFIDSVEAPPWDAWVCQGSYIPEHWRAEGIDKRCGFLVFWVPPEFVQLMDEAVQVMSSPWLWWVVDTHPRI